MTTQSIKRVAPLVLGIWIGFFFVATFILFSNERENFENVLAKMTAIVETMAVPGGRDARRFLHIYEATDTGINEANITTYDWKELHERTVEQQQILFVCQDFPCKRDSSWLNSTFHAAVKKSVYGTSYTPIEANTIYFVDSDTDSNDSSVLQFPVVKLWFARSSDRTVHILTHIKGATAKRNELALRLRVHFNQSKEFFSSRDFRIQLNQSKEVFDLGDVLFQASEDETLSIERPPDDLFAAGLTGAGWRWESNWYFKLALAPLEKRQDESIQIDAVELFLSTPWYQIGTRGPLPLEGYIDTYDVARSLFHMTPHYELYRRELHRRFTSYSSENTEIFHRYYPVFGIRDPSSDSNAHETWRAWLLTPLYQSYFFLAGIKDCREGSEMDTALCYRDTGDAYRLRVGTDTENKSGLGKPDEGKILVSVFTETDLYTGWDPVVATLSVVVVLMLGGAIFKLNRNHLLALRRSDQINEGLRRYDATFIHQGRGQLSHLETQALYLTEETDSYRKSQQLDKIRESLNFIWHSLRESTYLFDKREVVSKTIAYCRHLPKFDVAESLELFVRGAEDRFGIQIDFYNNVLRNNSGKLLINSTGKTKDSEDDSFIEALETLVENARRHGDPDKGINVSLDVEKQGGLFGLTFTYTAVIRVSNYGPKVPKRLWPRMFILGERYRHDQNAGRGHTNSAKEAHHGTGLFLMSQIVEAYGGDYRMATFDDPGGKEEGGVVVTFRLPAEFKPVTDPHTSPSR